MYVPCALWIGGNLCCPYEACLPGMIARSSGVHTWRFASTAIVVMCVQCAFSTQLLLQGACAVFLVRIRPLLPAAPVVLAALQHRRCRHCLHVRPRGLYYKSCIRAGCVPAVLGFVLGIMGSATRGVPPLFLCFSVGGITPLLAWVLLVVVVLLMRVDWGWGS